MKNKFFDINRIPGNGFLILPLSMSRLYTSQDPNQIYSFLEYFSNKFTERTVDIIFLYTNGLYHNSKANSYIIRKKVIAQMITHKRSLLNIIKQHNKFSISAIHFISWDNIILQSNNYIDLLSLLTKMYNKDSFFQELIHFESTDKDVTDEQVHFVLEETLITYLLRQKLINLPYTLSQMNGWRLICYAGHSLTTDVYLHQKGILPVNHKIVHLDSFSESVFSSMYNISKKHLEIYDNIDLKKFLEKEKSLSDTAYA